MANKNQNEYGNTIVDPTTGAIVLNAHTKINGSIRLNPIARAMKHMKMMRMIIVTKINTSKSSRSRCHVYTNLSHK